MSLRLHHRKRAIERATSRGELIEIRDEPATFDPATAAVVPGVPRTMIVPASPPVSYTLAEVDGTNVLQRDFKVQIPGDIDFPPVPGMTAILAQQRYRIVSIPEETRIHGITLAYELQLRGTTSQ